MSISSDFPRGRPQGFTLIELLVTMAVVAVVAMFAIPSFEQMVLKNRMVSQVNEVASFIGMARSEATKRPNAYITLCPTFDNANCGTATNWEDGWLMMLDADGDKTLDTGDQVLQVATDLPGGNTLRISGFTSNAFVQFSDNGLPISAGAIGASSGSFIICDDRGAKFARAIVVLVSGQMRMAVDEDDVEDGIVNLHDGNNATCPSS